MRAAFLPALLLAACAMQTLPGDIEPLPSGTRVKLAEVYFDYDTWVQSTSQEKERAREFEPALTGAMAAAFEKEAKRLGIWDDGPEGVKVTIAMINASPRSALAGDALGYGAGRIIATADVTLRRLGHFEMSIPIVDDDVKGRLEELAVRIARHIRKRTR